MLSIKIIPVLTNGYMVDQRFGLVFKNTLKIQFTNHLFRLNFNHREDNPTYPFQFISVVCGFGFLVSNVRYVCIV